MVLQWLLAGLFTLLGGFGLLQSAVLLQSYFLLLVGLAMAASGTVLLVQPRPAGAAP